MCLLRETLKAQALSIPDSESYRRANEIIETVLHGLNESSDLGLVTWLRHPVSEGCTIDPKTQGSFEL